MQQAWRKYQEDVYYDVAVNDGDNLEYEYIDHYLKFLNVIMNHGSGS